ncbi:hypothetical protein AN286_07105 [Aliarcobacter cryaerophilus ATCC 43158]|uniref:Uncharacterized protein n=1 Tax=Aliarcobacter cryaerophilus ATCC 43158 TaxID=1032070 RepID=A0AAD0XAE2_9BACT|nr:hypothetical protein [Aliarcobacter cryaerophilus]AYJ79931.1 hypothetical protein ACRYA_0798 [Aliarcobacter cryaerophilus ATCC 43158]PRM97501.1 hypothetical protein CJ667_05825 [Aliarcobacter cryaerophilus]QCZ24164.1 hypothetical protein AN286_07105 [Aliarcobacter cryaerophilus ATCC 43158]
MKIIGDNLIPFEDFFKVLSIEDIKNTKANSMLFFDFNEELLKYSNSENLNFLVYVSSIKEALYASNFNAKYIVCKNKLAKKLQKIADNYMWDSKILTIIKSSDDLEKVALEEIDGAIYKDILEIKG